MRSRPIAHRRFLRDTGPVQRTRVNHLIRISPIRVIGANNEQIGVIETHEALRMAQEQGLDLVEISPDARPPVCKIMDYGKFKYEQSKKDQKNRAASKSTEMKEVRLGRSVKIDPHDVQIRIEQSRRFLMAGHKVLVTQRFRGREIAHKELGLDNLRTVCESLADISKLDQPPKWMGKAASVVLAPDKPKVEAIKRKLEKEKAERALAEGKRLEDLEAEAAAREAELEAKIAAADEREGDDEDEDAGTQAQP